MKPTVDGQNPAPIAPPTMVIIPIIYRVGKPSQVVQDFVHQQYEPCGRCENPNVQKTPPVSGAGQKGGVDGALKARDGPGCFPDLGFPVGSGWISWGKPQHYMGVSKKNGTTKWMVYNGKSYLDG